MIPNNRNKKGTGFTNLNRILQASKGSRLGGQVASGVQKAGQQVRGQIGQAAEEFQEKTGQEATKFGEEAQRTRDTEIGQVASGAEGINQTELQKKFADYRSGEYKGPKEIQDYESLASKATEAEQLGRLGRTSGGKQELLRRFVGGKDYSQGEQRLDTALLGLTGQRGLAEAKRSTRGLTGELGREASTARDLSRQLQQQATAFGEETLTKLGQAKQPTLEEIRLKKLAAEDLESKRAGEYESIKTLLASPDVEVIRSGLGAGETPGTQQKASNIDLAVDRLLKSQYFSPEETTNLKLYADAAQRLGLNTASLLSGGLTESTAQNIAESTLASQQEKDKLALIDRLMGKSGVDVGLQGPQDPYAKGQSSFKVDALQKAVQDEMRARNVASFEALLAGANPANALNAMPDVMSDPVGVGSDIITGGINQGATNIWREVVTNPVDKVVDSVTNPIGTVKDVVGRLPKIKAPTIKIKKPKWL